MRQYARITPEGTRDRLFEECRRRRSVENELRQLYQNYAYSEVMTPSLEFFDVFAEGIGEISQNELYTLTDNSGHLMVLRPDSTKPIARLFAAKLQNLELPLRLFYNQAVFRRNIHYDKKSDEIMQIGVELIGSGTFQADAEAVFLCAATLQKLFGRDFLLEIGHVDFVNLLLKQFDLPPEREEAVRAAVAQKNRPELRRLMKDQPKQGERLAELVGLFGGPEVLEAGKKSFPEPVFAPVFDYLTAVADFVGGLGLRDKVLLDLAVANDYQYYTGVVFKGFVGGLGAEVLSGGRYDTLYGDYGLNIPAIGFGVNVDAVSKGLKDRGRKSESKPLHLVRCQPGCEGRALEWIRAESRKGERCEFALSEDPAEVLAYARAKGAVSIVEVGPDGVREERL